jgi:hypothetical protein
MMWVATMASWRITRPGSERAGRGRVGWLETWCCSTWCRPGWSGARSRSRAWLRQTYPERRAWHICHETIYQAIYHGGNPGLTRKLTAKLRTGRPLRKVTASRVSGRPGSSHKAA